jgi:hypothetical protein
VGLCFDCQHARRISSARGSTFFQCDRAQHDPSYARYPRLPMIECRGYERVASPDLPNHPNDAKDDIAE